MLDRDVLPPPCSRAPIVVLQGLPSATAPAREGRSPRREPRLKHALLAILLVLSASVDVANSDAHQNLAKAAKEICERRCRVEAPWLPVLLAEPEAGCHPARL